MEVGIFTFCELFLSIETGCRTDYGKNLGDIVGGACKLVSKEGELTLPVRPLDPEIHGKAVLLSCLDIKISSAKEAVRHSGTQLLFPGGKGGRSLGGRLFCAGQGGKIQGNVQKAVAVKHMILQQNVSGMGFRCYIRGKQQLHAGVMDQLFLADGVIILDSVCLDQGASVAGFLLGFV